MPKHTQTIINDLTDVAMTKLETSISQNGDKIALKLTNKSLTLVVKHYPSDFRNISHN